MSVRVAVRFRPDLGNNPNEPDYDEIEQNLLIYPQLNCVNVARHFNLYFHDVLPIYSTQDEVFNIVQPLVDDFLQGNNVAIITYGPAGCGKTYTQFGNGGTQTNPENVYRLGLMPRVISYIFDQLQQRFNPMNGQFVYQLQLTFAEIFNKKILDLLAVRLAADTADKQHKKRPKFIQKQNGSYDYANLTKVTISSIADVLRYMYQAFRARKYVRNYEQHKNKYTHSKSHSIATLKLIFKRKDTNELYKVCMVFMDCGAYCKSVTNGASSPSEDSQYINRAFLSLGNVITGLHRGSQDDEYAAANTPGDPHHKDIPWKDNILTQTLHSLCTSHTPSKMLLFLNCSLKASQYEETLATLRFGNLAMTDPMLLNVMDNYRKKIKSLHAKMAKYKAKKGQTTNSDLTSIMSSRSTSSVDRDDEEMNKLSQRNKELMQELNALKSKNKQLTRDNDELQNLLDDEKSQCAAFEIEVVALKEELARSQTNEQLLRDENDDLLARLNEINTLKVNKMQYIDNNLMKRTSIIHSTLKRSNINNDEQSKMVDELSQQIADLENLKAELKYQLQQKDEKLQQLSQKELAEKQELDRLQREILNYKTNYMLKASAESEMQQYLEQIEEQNARINEYEREMKENLYTSSNWKEQQETYESQIKHLEQQLNETKRLLQEQHEKFLHLTQTRQHQAPSQMHAHQTQHSGPMEGMLSQKPATTAPAHSNGGNHTHSEAEQQQRELIEQLSEQIRNLKLENARLASNEYKDEKIAKLKKKNHALEERLIKSRSQKAKMMPQLLQSNQELKMELVEMKTSLALYLVKWKFIQKMYQKQIRDLSSDVARYQRKLDMQIKGKQKMGNQMEMLDKLAQDTVKNAVHQRVISAVNVSADQLPEDMPSFEQMQTGTSIIDDSKADEVYQPTLPENLRRVQGVISDLTTKLQKKHKKIDELETKLAMYELSMSRSSMAPNANNPNQFMPMTQFMRDQSHSISMFTGSQSKLFGTGRVVPAISSSAAPTQTSNTRNDNDSPFTPNNNDTPAKFPMFGAFSMTTTDLTSSTTHIEENGGAAVRPSLTVNDSSMRPEPAEYAGDEDSKENEAAAAMAEQDQFASQEQYLQAFLRKQTVTLPPTPEKQLSLGFVIDGKRNIRAAVDVNMTFWDILAELQVHQPSDIKNLELHVEQNPEPIDDRIAIPSEWMNRTFWDLIIEFGIFSLLKFKVVTNAIQLKQQLQVQDKKTKKSSSIFKRFKSKKNVSK